MNPLLLLTPILVLALSAAAPSPAAMNDTGPMGTKATGVPTPDAAVLSKMQLLDTSSPLPGSYSASVATESPAARKKAIRKLWLQMQAFTARLDKAVSLGKLKPGKAEDGKSALKAIKAKYQWSKESDGLKLTPHERLLFKAELEELESKGWLQS